VTGVQTCALPILLSTSQFISIFTTVAGIILLLTVVKKQKQEANISLNSKG